VDHPCKQCGATVEDGTPFCHSCGAPQIRVTVSSSESATPPGEPGQTSEGDQPAAAPLTDAAYPPGSLTATPAAASANALDRRAVIFAALTAGLVAGMGTLVPFVPFISLCMVAAGGVAITLYKRRMPYVAVNARRGFRIGALAGCFGFLLNAITSSLGMLSAGNRTALRSEMQERLKEALASNSEPTAQQMMKHLGERITTPAGLAFLFLLSLCLFGLMFVLLSGVGGAIGAALFGKKAHR
jgi:hypothetical protein